MNNTKNSKNSSFLYKKFQSLYSNIVKLQNIKYYHNKIYKNEISFDNSFNVSSNKISSLSKTKRTTKDSKFIHNISSPSIYNYKIKKNYNNFNESINQKQKFHNSVINNKKKTKIFNILSQYKNKNNNNNINNSHISLKNESITKIMNNKSNLKLSSEYNYTKINSKDFSSSISKREINFRTNRSNKNNDNEQTKKLTQNILNNKFIKKVNKVSKESKINNYINRQKQRCSSIINKDSKNFKIKRIFKNDNNKKNNNFYRKENKKEIKINKIIYSKNNSMKIYSKNLSCNNIKNNYSQKFRKKLFSEKSNEKQNISEKNFLSNYKNKNKKIIKNENLNQSYDNYIYNSDKKITVNLKQEIINKNDNKIKADININMNLLAPISPHCNDKIIKNRHNISQSQIFFSPITTIFTKTHENSISILSSNKIFKYKSKIDTTRLKKDSRLSIESSNKLSYFSNSQEADELKDIIELMRNKLQKLKNSNNYYLNGEKNFLCSPDGPEDFHFRFVELCKQNNLFYKNFHLNILNKEKKQKLNNKWIEDSNDYNYKEYFENFDEEVPYI